MTDEEREVIKRASEAMKIMLKLRPVILADIEAHGAKLTNAAGSIPCPICETGRVAYTYAGAYNGHVAAACSTEGCVRWME